MDIAREPLGRRRITPLARGVAFAVGGALALAAAALTWRSSAAAPAVERAAVWSERVKQGDLLRQVPVQGSLVPERVLWLSALSAARVAKIAVRPGARVDPDTVVMTLENPDLELATLEAERQVGTAESLLVQLDVRTRTEQKVQEGALLALRSDLGEAERRAALADKLAPEGLVSAIDHGSARIKADGLAQRAETEEARRRVLGDGRARQLASQRAELERLREIAKFRRRQLALLEVRAGIRGIVQDVPLQTGQWVAIGTMLAKIAEPERLKAEVKVAEANARDVRSGLAVRFEAATGSFRGRVERVDPTVIGGNVRLEVTIAEGLPAGARADQAVSGYVEIETIPRVLFVARPAGAQDASTGSVFRLEPDGVHATRVAVRFGRGSSKEVEITSGLSAGDEVVVSDTASWDAGGRIRLK